jgi:lipopolysaccharide export system protein LptC
MRATVAYDPARHAWHASRHDDLAPAFRRARRHSRLVRLLRWGIPLAIVGGIALNTFGTWIIGKATLGLPALGPLNVSGSKITMDRPRLAGYTRDGRAYEMNAESAAQDMRKPQVIELNKVRTRMQLRGSGTVLITADAGTYDSKTEMVSLRQNVLCVASDGTEMRLSEALVDVRKGHVVSQKPVDVTQPRAHIAANAMEVMDNGAVVVFRGNVRFTSKDDGSGPGNVRLGEASQ